MPPTPPGARPIGPLTDAQLDLLHRADRLSELDAEGLPRDVARLLAGGARRPAAPRPPRRPAPPLPGALAAPPLPAAFAADGVAVVGPLLGPDGVAALAAAADRLVDAAFAASGMPTFEDWIARVVQVEDPDAWDPGFAALAAHPGLEALAGEALGGGALAGEALAGGATCAWSQLVLKAPRVGAALPWHTDRPTFPWPDDRPAVVVWLSLDPLSADSGALEYRPGSHRAPAAQAGPTTCPRVPRGAALLHHADVLHRSRAHASEAWRRAWVGVFCPA